MKLKKLKKTVKENDKDLTKFMCELSEYQSELDRLNNRFEVSNRAINLRLDEFAGAFEETKRKFEHSDDRLNKIDERHFALLDSVKELCLFAQSLERELTSLKKRIAKQEKKK